MRIIITGENPKSRCQGMAIKPSYAIHNSVVVEAVWISKDAGRYTKLATNLHRRSQHFLLQQLVSEAT